MTLASPGPGSTARRQADERRPGRDRAIATRLEVIGARLASLAAFLLERGLVGEAVAAQHLADELEDLTTPTRFR